MFNKPLTHKDIEKIRSFLSHSSVYDAKSLDRLYRKARRSTYIENDTGEWQAIGSPKRTVIVKALKGKASHNLTKWLVANIKDFSRDIGPEFGGNFYNALVNSKFSDTVLMNHALFCTVLDCHARGQPYSYEFPEEFINSRSNIQKKMMISRFVQNHMRFQHFLEDNPEKRAELEKAGVDMTLWDEEPSREEIGENLGYDPSENPNQAFLRPQFDNGFFQNDASTTLHEARKAQTLEEYMQEKVLQPTLKANISSFLARQAFDKATGILGSETARKRRHLMFSGSPGVGKTSLARVMGRYFKELGILERGHVVETTATALIGSFVGQTAPLVRKAVENAKGGILFIDEIYHFADDRFGVDAVNELISQMENHGDEFLLIVAGYSDENKRFLEMNPGLRDRFGNDFLFEDFAREELRQILHIVVSSKGMMIEDGAVEVILDYMETDKEQNPKSYANGRTLEKVIEDTIDNHALAVSTDLNLRENFEQAESHREEILTITENAARKTVVAALNKTPSKGGQIGFGQNGLS